MPKQAKARSKESKNGGKTAVHSNAIKAGDATYREHKKRLAARTTTMKLVWRGVTARIKHTPNYISTGWSHVEITVLTPKGAPLPITSTGYKSHFLDEEVLKAAGGPVAFFLAWIEEEARTKAWARADFKWRQLELFDK